MVFVNNGSFFEKNPKFQKVNDTYTFFIMEGQRRTAFLRALRLINRHNACNKHVDPSTTASTTTSTNTTRTRRESGRDCQSLDPTRSGNFTPSSSHCCIHRGRDQIGLCKMATTNGTSLFFHQQWYSMYCHDNSSASCYIVAHLPRLSTNPILLLRSM